MNAAIKYTLFALAAVAIVAGFGLQATEYANFAVFGWTAGAVLAAAGVIAHSALWGTLAASLVAASASGYLFWLKIRPTDGPAICTVNQTIDCESINNSPYSVLFGGTDMELPITLLGLGFFLGLAGATLWAPKNSPRLFQVSALFSLFNVIVSLYLASILVVEFKVCIFCITIYVSNLLILWAAFKGLSQAKAGLFSDLGTLFSDRSLWTITGVFAAAVIGGFVVSRGPGDAPPVTTDASGRKVVDLTHYYAPAPAMKLDGTEPVKGAENARYTVVEFADYACPHCAHAGEVMGAWLPKQDDVQLMFKVFPLTKECNRAIPEDNPSNMPQRCIPAFYAECAMQQGAFWPVNHDLFVNQRALAGSGFNPEDLNVLVKNRGVDVQALEACLESPETTRGVLMDGIAGARAGVGGTPAFYVRGVTDDGSWVMVNGLAEQTIELITEHRKQFPTPVAPPVDADTDAGSTDDPTGDTDAGAAGTEAGGTDGGSADDTDAAPAPHEEG